MGNENPSIYPPVWKIWATTVIGSLITLIVGMSMATSNGQELFVDPDARLGSMFGGGIASSLIVWTAAYFFILRRASKLSKWLVALVFIAAGITSALLAIS